jgi:prefoldin subunit 5
MGLLTLNKVEELDKKLQAIEKHLLSLEMKIDIISKENNSIKNIEANIVKIKNQMFSINKNIT